MEGKMNKKKTIIGVTIIIILALITMIGIYTFNVVNAKKISNSIKLGIKNLTEENYEDAKVEFSKILSIDKENEDAKELLTLMEKYIELNDLYESKEYYLASELITKLNENKQVELLEEKINSISDKVKEKIRIMAEIDNIESQINPLLEEKKYDEAIKVVDKYLNEDLKEDYLSNLNNLKSSISKSKLDYEEEQRIAEEKRLEEERKAEEQKRLQEQQKAELESQNETNNNLQQMISKERVKEILDGRINYSEITFENYDQPIVFEKNGVVYWAYKQIWKGESGTFLIIDMFTGKVIVSEKLDFDHGEADFYYPGY